MSITILAPQATGLAENQNYIPALVQGEFVSNFSSYSAISVLDWEKRDALLVRMISGAYSDSVSAAAAQEIGNAIPTTHFMQGNITKTATGYSLQMNIIKTADKTTAASFSQAFTFAELDNLTGIRQASLDLLQKLGVTLTENAQQALAGAATANHITAQTALARGVTAQRQGTEVVALSYYFRAAEFDPTLLEAVNRSSILTANISSGNMGENIRNEIQWRKQWIDRLTETEQFFDEFFKTEFMPYTLSYLDTIYQGAIDFQKETVTLSIEARLSANQRWSHPIERTLRMLWDGLNATNKKDSWGLGMWPQESVIYKRAPDDYSSAVKNVFDAGYGKDFSVLFELVNNQNKVIGKETLRVIGGWSLERNSNNPTPTIEISAPQRKSVDFQNVNVNNIIDNLTIRVANINGIDAETTAATEILKIRAVPSNEKGSFIDSRDRKNYRTARIGFLTWMLENLNYQTPNSWCYDNKATNCAKYGRLYTWDAAMSACPAGWRLSTDHDWNDLVYTAGIMGAGKKLKSKSDWYNFRPHWIGTDELGFSALPGGFRYSDVARFDNIYSKGNWWLGIGYRNEGFYRSMSHDDDGIPFGRSNKAAGLSVRCVQD